MWLIAGTTPKDLPTGQDALYAGYSLRHQSLCLEDGTELVVERGIEALAAAAWHVCQGAGIAPPRLLLGTDRGSGQGSKAVYAWLERELAGLAPKGITFHYLFPDVDWHNRVLMAVEALPQRPLLVADAGYMYAAKMSGYADAYDLFTPDTGEMAFLADEKAPHPFYTRGFLLDSHDSVETLLHRARSHGNVSKNLIIKGSVDHIVNGAKPAVLVDQPSVPAMEAIGGTGDLVTGLVTGFLAAGLAMAEACLLAARTNRELAAVACPTPATQVGDLVMHLGKVLR